MLERFLHEVAGHRRPTWTHARTSSRSRSSASARRSATTACICGLSGGVDSAVAAALVQRAVGDQLTCVFVDHGLLREGEAEQVEQDFVAATGVDLVVVDARERSSPRWPGSATPSRSARSSAESSSASSSRRRATSWPTAATEHVEFLVQGTLYPDVVESGGGTGAANIKSHHNVGGLPDDLQFGLVEPLRALFKDEVRGRRAGARACREAIVWRQPFPGPGLGDPHRR